MRIKSWVIGSSAPAALLWLTALASCGFPKPAEINDDAGSDANTASDGGPPTGCADDNACSAPTPFCLDRVCVACKTSASCSAPRPVCDLVSHDCRNCVKDSECDSGACDLGAGACVDPSAILYASPGGTPSDPCARLLPCSLDKAATSADAGHPYIVLLPGVHTANAFFGAQNVILCGNDATIDTNLALIRVDDGSSVTIRNLKLVGTNLPDFTVITNDRSKLTLDHVTIDLSSGGVYAIDSTSSSTTLIRGSSIIHGFLRLNGTLTLDESTLIESSIGLFQADPVRSSITNSVLVSSMEILSLQDPSGADFAGGALVANNTFVGGNISCGAGMPVSRNKNFESNIFFGTSVADTMPGCHYNYNLLSPAQSLAGTGNIIGDPSFVNADGRDFHLRAGSPAIDAANPSPLTANTHDHDGHARPQNGRIDIGAFEYYP